MKPRHLLTLAALMLPAACDHAATAPDLAARPDGPLPAISGTSSLLVDTGPGPKDPESAGSAVFSGQPPGCEPVPYCEHFQFLGGQFTLAGPATITSIEGWLRVDVGGRMEVAIRDDAIGDGGLSVPGDVVHASRTFDIESPHQWEYRWHTFSGFSVQLPAGTYWIALEPVEGMEFEGAMASGVPYPLANYAFHSNPNNRWINLDFVGEPRSFGFRVWGSGSPAEEIAALRSSVAALGLPHGVASALDALLLDALRALEAGDVAGACDALATFAGRAAAQAGGRIPAEAAAMLVEAATPIRAALGC